MLLFIVSATNLSTVIFVVKQAQPLHHVLIGVCMSCRLLRLQSVLRINLVCIHTTQNIGPVYLLATTLDTYIGRCIASLCVYQMGFRHMSCVLQRTHTQHTSVWFVVYVSDVSIVRSNNMCLRVYRCRPRGSELLQSVTHGHQAICEHWCVSSMYVYNRCVRALIPEITSWLLVVAGLPRQPC